MRRGSIAAGLVCLAFVAFVGCFEGGMNFNEQSPGNNDRGGVDLAGSSDPGWTYVSEDGGDHEGFGEIAVDPGGRYLLSRVGSRLVHADVASGETTVVPGLERPSRIAFAWHARRFYATSESTGALVAYDADTLAPRWSFEHAVCGWDARLYPTPDDAVLVVACADAVLFVDASTGRERARHDTWRRIEDVDITPDSAFALVTLDEVWKGTPGEPEGGPETEVRFLDTRTGRLVDTVRVPNCAAPLTMAPDGARAFLAPTRCGRDPISVVNVNERRFVRNLPGFGPIAMASDGNTAVGFVDRLVMDPTLFREEDPRPDRGARYHVMLIDTRSLQFRLVPIGDTLPRFALTPDGDVLLVDWDTWWGDVGEDRRIRVLDVASGELRVVSGPAVQLDHFTLHPNGDDVYLLSESDLYWLSIPDLRVQAVSVTGHWRSLNLTPGGRYLLLMDFSDRLTVYDVLQRRLCHTMEAPLLPTDDDFDWGSPS